MYKTSHTQKKKEYTRKACGGCPLKPQCTDMARRIIVLDFYEDAREDAPPGARRFGVGEAAPGNSRASVRNDEMANGASPVPGARIKKAKAELALGGLSYNLKRVIAILGVPTLLHALQPSSA